MPSRGPAMSAYSPHFNPKTSAKVYGNNIQSGVITSAHMAAGMNLSGVVTNGTVTSAKLASNAVVSVKILAGAVISAKLGAKAVTSAKINAAFLSGTLVSGKITKAIAHGLGVKPKFVVVAPLHTLAQAISATPLNLSLAAASAATSTNIYVIGNQPTNVAMKYVAYVQL